MRLDKNVVREPNPTHMVFLQCYVEDPSMDRKSTREFRRVNSASRQRTSDNSLAYNHRTAYPAVLCDARPASPQDNKTLFQHHQATRPFTPAMGVTLQQIGKTTKQVDHDDKTLYPKTQSPISHEPSAATGAALEPQPPKSSSRQPAPPTAQEREETLLLKRIPYDAVTKEIVGPLNSLHRHDYGHGVYDMNAYGAYKLPRPKPSNKNGEGAKSNSSGAEEVSEPASKEHVVHTRTKHEFRAATSHLSELKAVQEVVERHAGHLAEPADILPGVSEGLLLPLWRRGLLGKRKGRPSTARPMPLGFSPATASLMMRYSTLKPPQAATSASRDEPSPGSQGAEAAVAEEGSDRHVRVEAATASVRIPAPPPHAAGNRTKTVGGEPAASNSTPAVEFSIQSPGVQTSRPENPSLPSPRVTSASTSESTHSSSKRFMTVSTKFLADNGGYLPYSPLANCRGSPRSARSLSPRNNKGHS